MLDMNNIVLYLPPAPPHQICENVILGVLLVMRILPSFPLLAVISSVNTAYKVSKDP